MKRFSALFTSTAASVGKMPSNASSKTLTNTVLKRYVHHSPAACGPAYTLVRGIVDDLGHHKITSPVQWMSAGKKFISVYDATQWEDKAAALDFLASSCGVDHGKLLSVVDHYTSNKEFGSLERLAHRVNVASRPLFYRLLQSVGNIENGVKFIGDLRADVLALLKQRAHTPEVDLLRPLEETLRDMLTLWFCSGMLQLDRLTWQSSCELLQKVAEFEAVHPVRHWYDIKRRVGADRRCYVFTHPAMPREPLVVLHVALMDRIGDSIQEIIRREQSDICASYDESSANSAIFYSISSTQKGLQGIDLGNMLIKRVVGELLHDLPGIVHFCTLSPIPGFRTWLLSHLKLDRHTYGVFDNAVICSLKRELSVQSDASAVEQLKALIEEKDGGKLEMVRKTMMHLGAKYLYEVKHRGYSANPVANFHLRNGAELYRLNWMGDTSRKGLEQSLGMMVNYRYVLADVEQNSVNYASEKVIAIHDQVAMLLRLQVVEEEGEGAEMTSKL